MKKIFISVLALAALASCSNEDNMMMDNDNNSRVAIVPNANIENNVISRAAVEGKTFSKGDDVFRLCAFLASGDAEPQDWTATFGTEAFEDMPVNCSDDGNLSLNTSKYYPASGSGNKLWFYAYAPYHVGNYRSASTGPTVTYTITGQEDIMTGQVKGQNGFAGAAKNEQQLHPALEFKHLLKKITFKVKAGDTFDASSNTKVAEIVVKNVRTNAILNVTKGTLTFEGEATNNLRLTGLDAAITKDGTVVNGCLMFEAGTEFIVSETAGGVAYADATVNLSGTNAGQAGVSHEVTLTFNRSGIIPTATIVDWVQGDGTNVDIQ